jgi:hypothetical protein
LSDSVKTRWISFAGRTISIEYDTQAAKVIEFLYQHVPADEQTEPHVNYRLLCDAGRFSLYRGESLIFKGNSEAALAGQLLGDTGYHLADQSTAGLFFHAAGLAWQGKGLLIPGSSGAGKTTLTAWLLSRGFQYLSDEFVFIPHESTTMHAFTRPLNLKRPSRPVLQTVLDYEQCAADIISNDYADLVPPALLNNSEPGNTAPLALIIFPHYDPDNDFSWQPLSKAQTGLQLMQALINARNLSQHGFLEATRLAKIVSAVKICYRNFEEVGQRIEMAME